jgi:hypothetical protein
MIRPRFYFVNLSGADEFAASKTADGFHGRKSLRDTVRTPRTAVSILGLSTIGI